MMHYRDNASKFEEACQPARQACLAGWQVYEKRWKPYGNKYYKQSDYVKIFLNSRGYSEKFVPCTLFILFVFWKKGIVGAYKVVIIDEIQRIENAGLLLKLLVDNFKGIQILATGSSALEISDTVFEPMTGRYFLFHLYPFSLEELYPTKSAFELE